ncbi:hypothetical protein ACIREO_38390 [Streptomyces sp. NPDC102441]|uniref:hypothetical protein n=1 Tax=Streptomyces sp. NPDC102441 TaxID=3366176 RepID=UPI00380143B2
MSKLMLKASVNAKVWANTSVERMKARADQDRGQSAVEYLGIIVVVVAIIGVLMTTNLGNVIAGALTAQIAKVTGG